MLIEELSARINQLQEIDLSKLVKTNEERKLKTAHEILQQFRNWLLLFIMMIFNNEPQLTQFQLVSRN